ncbi:MAG: ATP-binding protein [Verrucomicrobiota bacterium]
MPVPTAQSARWLARPLLRWSVGILLAMVGGVLAFEALDISVFSRIGNAHEICYLREPKLIWLHVISDLLIGLAYVSISATLGYLVYKASRGIPFNGVFLAFGLFIVSCGMTHFMEIWVIWEPVYWLSGYVKVVTAAASVATAVALFPLVPKVFAFIESVRKSEDHRLEIEQLNAELEKFNYSVAHDLRAPLRGITGFGHLLRQDYGEQLPPKARDYIDKMQRSAAQMDTLICDLLKYATIARQQMQPRLIALDDVVRSATTLLESELRACDAIIRVPAPLPVVTGDGTLLQIVFLNLIGNAIKFVAPGVRPEIEIVAQSDVLTGRTTISIIDNGLGVPPAARQQIFRIFERFHPKYPGTGIGLAIVHRAIERLNGEIGVAAAPTGTGTRFWFQLPLPSDRT